MTCSEIYLELLARVKQYLTQEYALGDRILAEPETYAYFKAYALENQKNKNAVPQPSSPEKFQPIKPAPVYVHPRTESSKPAPVKPATLAHPSEKIETTTPLKPREELKKSDSAKTPEAPRKFALELPPPLKPADFTELRKIIGEKLPQVRLQQQLPDDDEAKALASAWMQEKQSPEVMILSFDEAPKHQAFLANIAKTLKVYGINAQTTSAAKLERNNEWQKLLEAKELKLVIASSSGFYHLPGLQRHYREGTKQGRHYLGSCLLLLLSDLSFYAKEPSLKPSLWAAIKELWTAARKP